MSYFVEGNSPLFSLQITTFSEQLPNYLSLGFNAGDVTAAVNDAAFMAWLVKCDASVAKHKLGWTSFLGLSREGSADVLILTPLVALQVTLINHLSKKLSTPTKDSHCSGVG